MLSWIIESILNLIFLISSTGTVNSKIIYSLLTIEVENVWFDLLFEFVNEPI